MPIMELQKEATSVMNMKRISQVAGDLCLIPHVQHSQPYKKKADEWYKPIQYSISVWLSRILQQEQMECDSKKISLHMRPLYSKISRTLESTINHQPMKK